ncbi:unnamed protein product [Rodentolepis nana]|uniref:DNA-directed RNA polymerase n=1 Tax=Rodentolepis nana TaxID=102285 RepID=A0A0R3TE97_RODNA|nr:unnamed protein product [Rodentolepis nana]
MNGRQKNVKTKMAVNGLDRDKACLGLSANYGGFEINIGPTDTIFGKKLELCANECRLANCPQCRTILILEELEKIFDSKKLPYLEYLYVNMDHNRFVPMSAILKIPEMVALKANEIDLMRVGEHSRMLEMDKSFTKFRIIYLRKFSCQVQDRLHWNRTFDNQLPRETTKLLSSFEKLNIEVKINLEKLSASLAPSTKDKLEKDVSVN